MPQMLLSIMISAKVIHQSSSQFCLGVTRGTVYQKLKENQEIRKKKSLDKQIISFPERESGNQKKKSQGKLSFFLSSKLSGIQYWSL